jgi:hypothetical protein
MNKLLGFVLLAGRKKTNIQTSAKFMKQRVQYEPRQASAFHDKPCHEMNASSVLGLFLMF